MGRWTGVDQIEQALDVRVVLELLESFEGLQARVDEGRLVVKYAPSQSAIDDIFARVQQAGLDIRDISTKEVDLEDLFITLTSEKAA